MASHFSVGIEAPNLNLKSSTRSMAPKVTTTDCNLQASPEVVFVNTIEEEFPVQVNVSLLYVPTFATLLVGL